MFKLEMTKDEADALTDMYALASAVVTKDSGFLALTLLMMQLKNNEPALESVTDKMSKLVSDVQAAEAHEPEAEA